MKIYLVGGAVRDVVIKKKVKDRDFVVVGATEQEMLDRGFKKIEATSFPVFHHPVTKEEYALARKERKTGKGYHGFTCEFDPSVTLEEDLFRRDLTINAMAIKVNKLHENGEVELDENIIDPYDGQKHIEARIVRHVSEHFVEDPVRALRVARLAARYMFEIHEDTIALVKKMARDGELHNLTAERVWAEVEKAMNEEHSGWFFKNLQTLNVINVVFPGMAECFDEQIPRYVSSGKDINEKLMILCSKVPPEILTTKMTVPNNVLKDIRKFHSLVFKLRMVAPNGFTENQIMPVFKELDAFRDKRFLHKAMYASCCFDDEYLTKQLLKLVAIFYEVSQIGFDDLNDVQKNMSGYEIGKAIDELRERKVQECFSISY